MFDSKVLKEIATTHRASLQKLADIEIELNKRFTYLEDAIRALILAVASGEPLLLIGPPGTAKSRLIRAFCELIGLIKKNDPHHRHEDYFEYLLTPFTEPGELFGYYNIAKVKQGVLERIEDGMMQNAKVVYLDEIFNSSSAILNSILAFMNERIFHDRGQRKNVAMKCLFAATNHIPQTAELRAIFDRFVLRCSVDNVKADHGPIAKLISKGWNETYTEREPETIAYDLLDEMEKFRKTIIDYTDTQKLVPQADNEIHPRLVGLVKHARDYELSQMSNRRIIKLSYIMLIHRIYDAVYNAETDEISMRKKDEVDLMYRYFLDQKDEDAIGNTLEERAR